ncbi:class I adenylate-forming enzyme family protein ['Paenibacillus yunnanensis' Narsing Rao et al. 2020]|uniref:class I adenylate-forming enzyme family protein n=1 Tax=Paenibacillus tengchongensis TaxID=2608684 RepID=UPI00124CC752|nr:class I adenylate-forming enzyme family protein [Paenibacillus tengchongensis]
MDTFNEYLELWANRRSESLALADAELELTYGQLLFKVRELQGYLYGLGLREGDIAGISSPRSVSLVLLYLAALGLGVSVVPLPEQGEAGQIRKILDLIPMNIVIRYEGYADPDNRQYSIARISRAARDCGEETCGVFIPYQLEGSCSGFVSHVNEAHAVYYNLTSGSTGDVKAVRTGSRELIRNALLVNERLPLENGDCYCCLFATDMHPHELFTRPIIFGACGLVLANHDLRGFGRHMRHRQITHLLATPHTLSNLLKLCPAEEDWQSIRYLLGTGEHVPYNLREGFYNRIGKKLISVWGCTEASGIVLVMPEDMFLEQESILGLPVPGYELQIEPDSGELLIRGECVMKGYWSWAGRQPVDLNGYYHTGDTVMRNSEGVFIFTGRADSFIKAGGRRVSLHALEQELRNIDGIGEVAAVYSDTSHTVGIFYSEGVHRRQLYPEILRFLNQALPFTKFRVLGCSELPKLTSGKVNKKTLMAKLH